MTTKKNEDARSNEMILWYRQPAARWYDALPVRRLSDA